LHLDEATIVTTGLGVAFWRATTKALLAVGSLAAAGGASAQDQFVLYFSGSVAGVGNLGGATFDADGNFWVVGRDASAAPVPVPRISKIVSTPSGWVAEPHVLDEDMAFFYRSADVTTGLTNPLWGGPQFGTPASFLLNPAPLTITIPTGTGGTTVRTYQPGELAFLTDAMGVLSQPNAVARLDATKKLFRYDLRKVDNPFGGVSGPTTEQPDFANASNGDGTSPFDVVFGEFGKADWNDVFTPVISELDLRDAAGLVGGNDNWGRSFAWSTDGQKIYAIDAGVHYGGIYRIDATQTGVIQRIWQDTLSNDLGTRINSEPAVIATSVRRFDPSSVAVGDQIIVEGSATGGNEGGINVFIDAGGPALAAPYHLITEDQFRSFSDYVGGSSPQYVSLTSDAAGNLYFYEAQTDGVFRYDPQGRLSKVSSERELNLFQQSNGASNLLNDLTLDLQTRPSTAPGFAVTELIYTDDALDTPVGILVFEPGDFDRNGVVDSVDLAMFAAALGPRWAPADDANVRFDLNASSEIAFNSDAGEYRLVSNGRVTVDWGDVKALQLFVDIPNGDVNFDGQLDFADIDVLSANYYTLGGQANKTWVLGDLGSIDPLYGPDAPDLNLVNRVDLDILADAWVNDLSQPAVTEAQALARGYSGVFLTDLLAAFAAVGGGLPGDYNGDGVVDAADYTVWRDTLGQTGVGLPADGNNDGAITVADFQIWRTSFGVTSGVATSTIVPEPATGGAMGTLAAMLLAMWRRRVRLALAAGAVAILAGEPRALAEAPTRDRLATRPEMTPDERQQYLAQLRDWYSRPSQEWPAPQIDPGVEFEELGLLPPIVHPDDNPPSREKGELGRRLFHDPRLSGSRQIACASCHDPDLGWGDGKTAPFGHDRKPLARNSPPILNSGYRKTLFWDGRAAGLEEQAGMVVHNQDEMHSSEAITVEVIAAIPEYQQRFHEAFGPDSVTLENVLKAIATFERTVVGGRSRFDRFLKGNYASLDDQALSGLHLFRTDARCANCHHGPLLTDDKFHHIGLAYYGRRFEDLGRYAVTGDPADVGAFRTPSLRDVTHTGPYMHNGLFTLDEVLRLYNVGMPIARRKHSQSGDPLFPAKSPLIRPLHLNAQDIADLEAFLVALEEPHRRIEAPPLPRFGVAQLATP
jgi:cytochrome c peroxidase